MELTVNTAITEYHRVIGEQYYNLIHICQEVCKRNKETFSEDKINDVVIKINNSIEKKGKLDDMSENGIMRYFVKSYVNELRCEKRYAYIKKRDHNITDDNFKKELEKNYLSPRDKIIKDLLEDFSVLYIMKMVELNFDAEHFYLYRLKQLCNMTYKQIHDKTKIPKSREKILEVQAWVRANLSRDIIKKEFFDIYGDLIEN